MKLFYILGIVFIVAANSGCKNNYKIEGNFVYYDSWNEARGSQMILLAGANPQKFKILKYDRYGKDDRLVFYEGDTVKGADAPTFEAIGNYYAHDKYRGYYAGDSIKGSQGRNFRIIDNYYTTDGIDIFYMTMPLHIESVKNFHHVYDSGEDEFERWTTDGKYYYWKNFKVPSTDYKDVILYKKSGGLSKDKRWVYFLNHKLNYDDSGKRVVDTIDAASFVVTGYLQCHDRISCFNPFHGRETCPSK